LAADVEVVISIIIKPFIIVDDRRFIFGDNF